MTDPTYSLDGLNDFLEQVGRSDTVAALCREAAEQALANAQDAAKKHKKSGDYLNSLHVEELPRSGRRVFGVVSDDPESMVIEAELGILARSLKGVKV